MFEPLDVLHLGRYGMFTTWREPGFAILPVSPATDVTSELTNNWKEPFSGAAYNAAKSLELQPHLGEEKWGAIVERFNWGATSMPDLVYYEMYNYGALVPGTREGFYCSGKVGYANIDNCSAHPSATKRIDIKVWNCSADYPRNVWVEFAVWLYWFPLENLPLLLEASDINLMQEMNQRHQAVVDELRALRNTISGRGGH